MVDPEGRSVGRHVPAQQPRQAQHRHRPQGARRAATSSSRWPRSSTSSPRTSRPARWPGWASATTTSPPCTRAVDLPVGVRVREHGADARTTRGPPTRPIVEAMSGIYEYKRRGDQPPVVAPVGALGDIGSGLFAVIGVLAALRHRDATGEGQHVDIAMLDAMVAMTDLVTNFWSMGLRDGDAAPLIMDGFRAGDGWFIIQVGREHQFARWPSSSASRSGSTTRASPTARAGSSTSTTSSAPRSRRGPPTRPRLEACAALSAAGHRRRAVLPRRRGDRRPARRRPPHARRDAAHRRRRRAGPRARATR